MQSVRGIGGVFFKSRDPKALGAWYRDNLGVPLESWGAAQFDWRAHDDGNAFTLWTPFSSDTEYFAPSQGTNLGDDTVAPGGATFMINYRVDDLDAMLAQLRAAGVRVDDKREDSEFGRFGWAFDPEGNKFELWQPPPCQAK